MSKDKIQLLSPLFLKYQADYEKNPRSRVFAPLAETYRKLGMTDKAMEILSQGIRFHPTYIMGYLGLSFCYFDLKQYSLAYNTLRPLVEANRDNIRLQKLFADVCLLLGHREEALDTYKYLLFINPRDKEVAAQVSNLENLIDEQYKPVHQPIYIPESEFKNDFKNGDDSEELFDINKLENKPLSSKADFDDWMALDLSRESKPVAESDPYEFWNLKKGNVTSNATSEPKAKIVEEERTYEGLQIDLDLDTDESDEEDRENESVSEAPLVTHTLVDLYCGQGHIEKALEVLEKILLLNPKDQKTIKKIQEIKGLMGPYEEERAPVLSKPMPVRPNLEILEETSEEDGRKNLMNIFDKKVGHVEVPEVKKTSEPKKVTKKASPPNSQNRLIEEKLTQFLKKIQKRALDYQARL